MPNYDTTLLEFIFKKENGPSKEIVILGKLTEKSKSRSDDGSLLPGEKLFKRFKWTAWALQIGFGQYQRTGRPGSTYRP